MELELTGDAVTFLDGAREHLAADPVVTTVVATVAARTASRDLVPAPEDWWATVRDEGRVVGVAMRTAPFAPRPAYVVSMPDEAARLLARTLHERGEDLSHVNGALPAAQVLLDELGRLSGRRSEVTQHTRLFELRTVVAPRPVPGMLRAARTDEIDLVEEWFGAFQAAADEQAGRAPDTLHEGHVRRDELRRRLELAHVWLWEDAERRVVHLSAVNPPAYGVARIGPVYTPREQRGRGWASAAVAELSQRVLDAGARPCLFTDQANPTSNAIYQAIGYEAVVDTASVALL